MLRYNRSMTANTPFPLGGEARFIGEGAQFRVFELLEQGKPTGRVAKIPRSPGEIGQFIAPHVLGGSLEDIVQRLFEQQQSLPDLFAAYSSNQRLQQLFGDPQVVRPQGELPYYYTQQKTTPLPEAWSKLAEGKQTSDLASALSDTVNLHHSLWQFGLFELSFKLDNIGVTYVNGERPQLCLLDIGEYTTSLPAARARLDEQPWRNNMDRAKADHAFLPQQLHDEYTRVCKEFLTPSYLERLWTSQDV